MLKSIFKWGSNKNNDIKKSQASYLYILVLKIVEDVVFWKRWWFSLLFLLCFNIIFAMCLYRETNLLQVIIVCCFSILITDAFESWLKYKHRTACLKRIGDQNVQKILLIGNSVYNYCEKLLKDYLYLRNINHTKAFLLLQIALSIIFIVGKYFNGFIITYICVNLMVFHQKLLSHIMKMIKRIQQHAESELELEGLLPDVSDVNMGLLSFEPHQSVDESLDCWNPEEVPFNELSDDSSDNSSSMVVNVSNQKLLTKYIENTDSSEDEFIPYQDRNPDLELTTMEVHAAGTWSNAAYNMVTNIGGSMINMVYNRVEDKKQKRVSSIDSSDGFEIIDKNDVL